MVDQEGGPVRRIPGAPRALGRRRSARPAASSAARRAGRAAGRNLRAAQGERRPGARRGRRAARQRDGARAALVRPPAGKVARFAGAFATGLRRAGVLATGKHFPGFGAARANTDNVRVTINTPRKRLRPRGRAPVPRAFRRGVRLVMLSTAIYTRAPPGRTRRVLAPNRPARAARPPGLSRRLDDGRARHARHGAVRRARRRSASARPAPGWT